MLPNGTVRFDDDGKCRPNNFDSIVYCTGYDYEFPFIDQQSNLDLQVGGRRVMPLFEQLWHSDYPNIAFLGLPHSVLPFPLFELQAQAVVSQLRIDRPSSALVLPGLEDRKDASQRDAVAGGPAKQRIQDTHYLGSHQWKYKKRLADFAGDLNSDTIDYLETNKVRTLRRRRIMNNPS